MEWLNYHHLLYFYTVAKEGTIAKAATKLRLAQPTISGQIRLLEESLGEKLFRRSGRNLVLTETGQMVFGYADEIFALGGEMMNMLKGRPTGRPMRLNIGISDVVPKLISHRLLEPALEMDPPVQIVCREDKTERLLAELSVNGLDMVLSDEPLGGNARVKAFNHMLGECGVSFMGTKRLVDEYRRGFPDSLEGAPMLVPTDNTLLRRSIESWFDRNNLRPHIVGEFEDTALMKVFGGCGNGIFVGPTAIENDIREEYSVGLIGRAEDVRERFYAITVERRIKHPAVQVISEAARGKLFSE